MSHPETYFKIASLITKFLDGRLSPEESVLLDHWIHKSDKHKGLFERLTDPAYLQDHLHYWEKDNTDIRWRLLKEALEEIERSRHKKTSVRVLVRKSLRYAAIIIPVVLLCGTGWYFLHHKERKPVIDPPPSSLASVYIMPKGRVAQLVLGNGKVVDLSDSLRETITEKDGTKVNNGRNALSYRAARGGSAETIYNTLIVPRGGEYKVLLSDGTTVWLNAASSLRFPVKFDGTERKVFLRGEGYFKVAEDATHPFVVNTGKMNIKVLGTSFDVSAYPDDPREKAVLEAGAIRVDKIGPPRQRGNGVMLKPGYEAVFNKSRKDLQMSKADIESALAWKNGMFIFDGESLGSIMRKLARWYDVNVEFSEQGNAGLHFTGRIKRFENITGLLNLIELTGKVKFSVVGSEVMVDPVE